MNISEEKSPKSYGTAVTLCGLFGTLGIHHFYLGDYLHGLADLALVVFAVSFFMKGHDGMAIAVILADAIHTVIIFYLLIIEKWRDGKGRPVTL